MSCNGMRTFRLNEWCKKLDDNTIDIPLIQRGFVWKAEQIAGLWDSLLRGFPIGSFMVQPKGCNSESVELIDGQQRGRSIAGGVNFKSENGFRVWIAGQKNQSNEEFKFDIKVTTDKHPFGFDNKFKKLSVSQRSKAFKLAVYQKYKTALSSDTTLTEESDLDDILESIQSHVIHDNNTIQICLDDTQPYSPRKKYVALDKLFSAIKKAGQGTAIEIVKQAFVNSDGTYELEPGMAQEISQALLLLLNNRQLYAIEVEESLHVGTDKTKNIDIEVLFKRVGTGGTELSDLDYAYSLLKKRLKGTQSYIDDLLGKNVLSSLFSSLDCVDILIRTSCFVASVKQSLDVEYDNGTDPTDSTKCNKKNLYKKIAANKNIIEDEFISKDISRILMVVVRYLQFDEKTHVNGLPIQLLQKLPKKLWQMLVILTYSERFQTDQNSYVRIALYWLLIAPTSDETAKIVHLFIEKIKKAICSHKNCVFDFEQELIGLIQNTPRKNNKSFAKLLSGSTFKSLTVGSRELFPTSHFIDDKYKLHIDDSYLSGKLFWRNKNLLLWLQRHYLQALNRDDRLKIFTDITLYDFDHIIPQHLWSGNSTIGKSFNGDYFKHESNWQIGNSIGNFQLLKFSDNRAKKSAAYNDWMKSLGESKNQVMTHSLLINSDKYFCKTVKKLDTFWSVEQRIDFVKGVETRVNDLYSEFLIIFDENSIYFDGE